MNFCFVIYLAIICALLPRNFYPFVLTCTTAATFHVESNKIGFSILWFFLIYYDFFKKISQNKHKRKREKTAATSASNHLGGRVPSFRSSSSPVGQFRCSPERKNRFCPKLREGNFFLKKSRFPTKTSSAEQAAAAAMARPGPHRGGAAVPRPQLRASPVGRRTEAWRGGRSGGGASAR